MNRVIRNAPLTSAPPAFAGGHHFVDSMTADLIEQARVEAFEAGRREGFAAGRADMEGAISRVDTALDTAVRNLADLRASAVDQTITAALEIAEFVVGEMPPHDGSALAERIRAAIANLDDEHIVVAIHPQDWDVVGSAVRLPNGVTIERDPSLAPGEARIAGRWATAELTREAALQIAREVLT